MITRSKTNSNNNNNNKRDNDSDNETYNIKYNKKQKCNNNDDNISNNSNEIENEILNLEKKTVIQLREYGKSIGLSFSSSIRKGDIIQQISSVLRRKQDTIKKEETDIKVNPFNKGVIEIKIIKDIEPTELLFWELFRNKFIYKKIMSNMDTHLSLDYDSIISVKSMIENGQLGILRDKVCRDKYISFSGYHNRNQTKENNQDYLTHILKVIKNDDSRGTLFYQKLFKNQGKYSLNFSNMLVEKKKVIEFENGREQFINDIIKCKCMVALKVMISNYNYKPTLSNLNTAIEQSTIKFIKLFLQDQSLKVKDIETLITNTTLPLYPIKSLDYLSNQHGLDITQFVNSKKPMFLDRSHKNIRISTTTPLKSLIIICKLLLKSSSQNEVSLLGEIESFSNSLSKQELKSELQDPLNQVPFKKEMIKKLLDCYFNFANTDQNLIPAFRYLYFDIDQDKGDYGDTEGFNTFVVLIYFKFVQAFQFANFKILEILCDHNKNWYPVDGIFTHGNSINNREKQMKFINLVIDSIELDKKYIGTIDFFYSIISYDNLEFIKHVSERLPNYLRYIDPSTTTNSNNRHHQPTFITQYIKSTNVLEYLFENHLDHFSERSIWSFKNVDLLKHFQLLHGSRKSSNAPIKLSPSYQLFDVVIDYQVLNHILSSGPLIYHDNIEEKPLAERPSFYEIIDNCSNRNNNDKIELCKMAYLKFENCNPLNYLTRIVCRRNTNYYYFIKFLDWHFKNCKNQQNEYSKCPFKSVLFLNIGRFDQVNMHLNYLHQLSDGFSGFQCRYNQGNFNYKLLDYYFNIKSEFFMRTLFNLLISNGSVGPFQYIQKYYGWLLQKKSTTNSKGIFTSGQLNQFLMFSLNCNQIELSEYLSQIIPPIKKIDFDKNCTGDISRVYFNNKFC